MSGHGHHDDDADPHAGHDDHHETTSDDFPADEPRSPGWLPLLGGALLLAGVFAFVVLNADDKPAVGASPTGAPAAAVVPTAANPAARPAPPIRPGAAAPPGHEQFVKRPAQ